MACRRDEARHPVSRISRPAPPSPLNLTETARLADPDRSRNLKAPPMVLLRIPFDVRKVQARTESGREAIVAKMYDEALTIVATAPAGNRNAPLNEQSYFIGRLVG